MMRKNLSLNNEIRTATDIVVEELQKRILLGELPPGTQLKNTQFVRRWHGLKNSDWRNTDPDAAGQSTRWMIRE